MRFCFLCEKLKLYIDIINKVGYYLSKTNGRKALLYTISTLMLKYKAGRVLSVQIYMDGKLYTMSRKSILKVWRVAVSGGRSTSRPLC